jgi:magnesium chelatase family protein
MTSHPPWGPDIGRTRGAAIIGIDGHLVEAAAAISNGMAAFDILGLPDTGIRETRDRVRAAVLNSGQRWPARAITVSLLPASLPKRGTGLDLAIAVAVLTAAGAVPADAADRCVFVAELGLDGSLRPVRGVLPAVLAAAAAGCTAAVVAADNAAEAATVPGVAVIGYRSLREVLAWLRREPLPSLPDYPAAGAASAAPPMISLASLGVAPLVRRALEASAAGGHHLYLTGPRGAALPALAAGLAGLLPPLDPGEVMQVSAVHSVAGLLESGHARISWPPYRAPHHTASRAAILGGGGGIIRPGEAALAHRGVLFLDKAPEFARDVLQALRQPLCDGEVIVARGGMTARFPARFILVAAMAPCPCGAGPGCSCSVLQARRYRARLAGELGSHIGIWLHPGTAELGIGEPAGDADAMSAARVAAARQRACRRLQGTPWRVNADIPGAQLRRSYQAAAEALAPISRAVDLGEISTRAAHQVLRVAWTLADLAGKARPDAEECGQALAFQLGVAR